MVSRRSFLIGSLGSLVTAYEIAIPLSVAAKKTPRVQTLSGPHSISREDWAPAIMPDHVGIVDRGYLCFTDDFGRLAIVDLHSGAARGEGAAEKSSVKIIGELNGIGNKIVDFAFGPQTAYGLVYRENENQEPVVYLVTVALTPASEPTIISQTVINRMTEGSAICFGNDMLCISGTSSSGENIASIYSARKGGGEPTYIASLTMKNAVRKVDIQDRQLVVLSSASGGNSQIDLVNLSNPSAPDIRNSIALNGDYRTMARYKDTLLVAGTESGAGARNACTAKAKFLSSNNQTAASLPVPDVTSVLSVAASAKGDHFVLLGENGGERVVVFLACEKGRSLAKEQVLKLPSGKGESGGKGTVVMKENTVYVASGWSGVTMLSRSKAGLALGATYNIPRLSAAGVANWGDLVVLAGAQLQLYNIARPERPSLINWADPDFAIKSIVGAGSFVLCLSKEEISLRKMDKLRDQVASVKVQASQLCFDSSQKTAFAIKSLDKTTRVTKIKVYADKMEVDKPIELPGIFNRCQAKGGLLLLSGLNEVALYRTAGGASTAAAGTASTPANQPELVGAAHFENLAIRDLAITEDVLVATAVDQNSKGSFLVLSKDDKDLHLLGSINLPSDGVALAASGNRAVAVGRNLDGKDVASIVTFANKINPQIVSTLSVIEGVSSVTIKDQLAVLAGRGLEIVTLG
ncbi:MAG: hypothetical protein JSS83_15905 [Cyanobacteria bacterium SZAS LIN-3]|nr:hypothetical protein [Cyanobacteria bacterium SZAS LIN-3]